MQSQTPPNVRPSESARGAGALARWGYWVAIHKWRVLGSAALTLAILGALAISLRGQFTDDFTIPGAESQKAFDLLKGRFPSQAGDSANIVFRADAGVQDPAVKPRIDAVLAKAATLPHVIGVSSPNDVAYQISADGKTAYATVAYDALAIKVPKDDGQKLLDLVDTSGGGGLQVEAGGQIVAQLENTPPGSSELIALAAAAVVLLIAFGSIVAMGLPLITAIAGLAAGFFSIFLATRFLDIATFTPAIAAMIGLGVGIDYALFIVTRYREGMHSGLSVPDAVSKTMDTAGRSVLFAGTVVVIALLGLLAIGLPFIAAFGVAAALVVACSIIVALTVLPALLAVTGTRIDKWGIKRLQPSSDPGANSLGHTLSRVIGKAPWVYAAGATLVLLTLAAPLLDLKLGFPDESSNPTSYHTRRAFDLMTSGFGEGFNSTFLITVEKEGGVDPASVDKLAAAIKGVPGIVQVAPPQLNQAGDTAVISMIPATGQNDSATRTIVSTLRDTTIPATMAGSGATTYVGGGTAVFVDLTDRLTNRTPIFFAIVIGLSFLLLTIVFRSPVIALKAAIMNLFSIAAAFGILIAVFQWGWGASLFGIHEKQGVVAFLPMFLFAILFGLSMDYEVFLLSRVREAWVHGAKTRDAVAEGLSVTARVITAAAAIMIVVFLSFVIVPDPISKQFGLGLASAIFVDATIVRLILVPATMELLGEWNWWFPSWLDRLVPHLNVEGSAEKGRRSAPAPAPSPAD